MFEALGLTEREVAFLHQYYQVKNKQKNSICIHAGEDDDPPCFQRISVPCDLAPRVTSLSKSLQDIDADSSGTISLRGAISTACSRCSMRTRAER